MWTGRNGTGDCLEDIQTSDWKMVSWKEDSEMRPGNGTEDWLEDVETSDWKMRTGKS